MPITTKLWSKLLGVLEFHFFWCSCNSFISEKVHLYKHAEKIKTKHNYVAGTVLPAAGCKHLHQQLVRRCLFWCRLNVGSMLETKLTSLFTKLPSRDALVREPHTLCPWVMSTAVTNSGLETSQ